MDFDEIYEISIFNTGLKGFQNRSVIHMLHDVIDKRQTKNQIKDYIKSLKDDLLQLYGSNYTIALNVLYDETIGSFRISKEIALDSPIIPFPEPRTEASDEIYEQETFKTFDLYLLPRPPKAGNNNNKFDCLYVALKRYYGRDFIFEDDKELRAFLNVKFPNPIPHEKLKLLSNKLKASILLYGDYPTVYKYDKSKEEIKLKLRNGHYIFKSTKESPKRYMLYSKPKKLMIMKRYTDKDIYYNEEGLNELLKSDENYKQKIKDIYENYFIEQPYSGDKRTLEEIYNDYIKDAKICNESINNIMRNKETKQINLLKHSMKDVILKLFYEFTRRISEPKPVDEIEAEWIEKATMGSIIYAKRGHYDYVETYDFNSQYMSLKCYLPYGKPEYFNLECLEENPQTGIYRAIIEEGNDLIRYNQYNYYTYTDIKIARDLGLNVELIQDGNINALIYTEKMPFSVLFGDLVKMLYDLKLKGVNMAKSLLSRIWGTLTEKNKHYLTTERYDIDITNKDIEKLTKNQNGYYDLCYSYKGAKKYRFPEYARFKPFILGQARYKLLNRAIKYGLDDIVRIHTDSITFNKQINLKSYKTLGKLKLEYKKSGYDVNIKNKTEMKIKNILKTY